MSAEGSGPGSGSAGRSTPTDQLDEMSFQWTTEYCSSAGCLNIPKKHELLGLIIEQRSLADVERHESLNLFSQCENVAQRINTILRENKIDEDSPEVRKALERIIEREFYAKEYPKCFVRTHAPKYTKSFFDDQMKRQRIFSGFCDSCVRMQGLWFVFDHRVKPPSFMLQHEMECKDRDACAKETMLMRAILNIQTPPFKAKVVKLPYDDQIFENSARVGTSGEEFQPTYCRVDDTNIILHCTPDKRLRVGQIAWTNGAPLAYENRYIQEGRTYTFTPVNEASFPIAKSIKVSMVLGSAANGQFEHPPRVISSYTKDFLIGRLVYEGARFHANFCGKLTILVVSELHNNYSQTIQPHRIGVDTEIMVRVPGYDTLMQAT